MKTNQIEGSLLAIQLSIYVCMYTGDNKIMFDNFFFTQQQQPHQMIKHPIYVDMYVWMSVVMR